ncbi:MAG TPA: porin [Saprospiraceae bacterium]|nr:porin [Saprospiraceae bacterium]
MSRYIWLVLFMFSTFSTALWAQQEEKEEWSEKLKDFTVDVHLAMQFWTSYSFDQEVYNEELQKYRPVDDRLNFQIRRSRMSFKAQAYERLKINMTAALDLVGRDELAATEGGFNNGGSPRFRIWNAYVQWKLSKQSEHLYVTSGYFLPQIGRESMTAALRSNSMEKAWSQNYLRRHMSGSGPGRVTGVNLGGLMVKENRWINYKYDIGLFSSTFGANTAGIKSSPSILGRMEFFFGDPEQDKYKLSHKVNYFGKRHGLSLAIAAAHQGARDKYLQNNVFSADFLFNHGPFQMDGEVNLLQRKGEITMEDEGTIDISGQNLTGYWRMGYNFTLSNGQVIEPVAMWMFFFGALDEKGQQEALTMGMPTAQELKWNMGFNWYLNPDLKISLFYTFRQADAGQAELPEILNNYFEETATGIPYRKGNWVGLGLVAII